MKTFEELYNFILKEDFNFDEFIIEKWEGKDKQESLFRLFCYLNIPKQFINFDVAVGNFDLQTIEKSKGIKSLMIKSLKDKGDKSDLTFINNKNNKRLILTTSKNISKYHIGDLDIEKIFNIFNEKYKPNGYRGKLCVVIPDKKYYYKMLKNIEENNQYLFKRCMSAIIIDNNDLRQWCQIFINNFKHISLSELYKNNKPKGSLSLYFHQELSIKKFTKLYQNENNILLGCIPRSGKSFIMAGIINYFKNKSECQNYLILTTCPNETINQYLDIFNNYIEFDDFNVYHLQKTTKPKGFKSDTRNIIICSEQFLKYKNSKSKKTSEIRNIKFLKELNIHIRFIDEAHNGGTTELSDKIMVKYGNGSKICFITATYTKPKVKFDINPKASILWDLEDVQLCKNLNKSESLDRLIEKHSYVLDYDEINDIINLYTKNRIIKEYSIYPELHLLTLSFSKDIEKEIIEETKGGKYGWSPESIFLLKQNKKDILEEFQNPEDVRKLCYNIFGKMGKYVPEKQYENCILNRIENIIRNPQFNSRWFDNKNPLTILCFLPCGNQSIDKLSNTFKNLIEEEKILENFEVGIINSKQTKKPLEIIRNTSIIAKNKDKKGVLILSGRQCSLGVSIHSCDIVLMLNNTSSMDQYLQMGFRSMTEAPRKKCGFIVDLNIQRVGNMLVEQAIKMYPSMSINKSIKKILRQRLINLNVDEWMDEYFGVSQTNLSHISRTLFNIYNYSPAGNIKNILDNLNFKYGIFSKKDQKLINTLFKISKVPKSKKLQTEKILTEDEANELCKELLESSEIQNGIEEIPVDKEDDNKKDKKSKDINFVRDIIKHVIPLICLLTIHEENKSSMEDMLNHINEIPDLKNVLIQQLRTWWGKHISKEVLNVFITIYNRYLHDIENFDNIINRIKEIFHINLNNKNKLSQIIDTYLLPHEIEIRNNAEIPTPYNLRQDMINLMVEYGDSNFWKSPKKVLEPTCGKGGFLLDIIDRFMKHLPIENVEERYKIIVEECLYFADINPQNIYICKLLLDPYGQYKLNYYLGDSLKYNPNFKFDLVIGNPPYNKGLYTKFVNYYINKCYNNIFVIPSNFTTNSTGKKLVNTLKNNGLYIINFLNRNEWLNKIDIDTLYYMCLFNYRGNLLINNNNIDRKSSIINFKNIYENNIHKKITNYKSVKLIKGKNKNLNYKNTKETNNIKFNKTKTHNNKLLSRLGGGNIKYYYISKGIVDESNFKLCFPRGTANYNSHKNLKNISKDMVYSYISDDKYISNSIIYIKFNNKKDCEIFKKYMMKSKLVRYIFMKYNHYSEMTITIGNFIPNIDFNKLSNFTDEYVFNKLNLNKEEITYINSLF